MTAKWYWEFGHRSGTWAVATLIIVFSASAQAETIYGCDSNYLNSNFESQEGDGLHLRMYQPMFIPNPSSVIQIVAIITGVKSDGAGGLVQMARDDFVGRWITVEILAGTYNPAKCPTTVICPDPAVQPFSQDIQITLEMLSDAEEDPVNYQRLLVDIATPPYPAGTELNVGIIGHFDASASEAFLVPVVDAVNSCVGVFPSGWWYMPDDPGPPNGVLEDGIGFPSGILAMAVSTGPPIPAVSTWGLVGMTLLMLTAGTLVCRSRMTKPIAA